MPFDDKRPFISLNIALATISDSRIAQNDKSGDVLAGRIFDAGHMLYARTILKDDVDAMIDWMQTHIADPNCDVILTTGGTGLTGRDSTPEAVAQVSKKDIIGFGEYFRQISAAKIGSSTIQSRACAGLSNGTYIFALPGSPSACKDGWDEILAFQLDNRFRPCNFVELIPRLKESGLKNHDE